MRIARRRFISLAAAALAMPAASRFASAQGSGGAPVFPAAQWEAASPAELGWSVDGLAEANRLFDTLPPSSMVVIDRGRLVLAWGDAARRVKLSSVRKSLLSALYGAPVRDGRISLDDTLQHLGIDDDPPLTQGEKRATLKMLLQSRSGVYHGYVGGTPDMREKMPAREAHAPGTFWTYNNWDFNVLGAVYERVLDKKIGEAFAAEIAAPIGMEDFRPGDMYYARAAQDAEAFARSLCPAYHFRLTARDMARFGYLYLRHGKWNGAQIIPLGLGGGEHDVLRGNLRVWRRVRLRLPLVGWRLRSRHRRLQRARRVGQIHHRDPRAGSGRGVRQPHGIPRRSQGGDGCGDEKAAGCARAGDEQVVEVDFGGAAGVMGEGTGAVVSTFKVEVKAYAGHWADC